jgi:tetratricopeptide (TPR) repeat protein
MRATLQDPGLARYAGRFVWLELDFDNPRNQPFIAAHGTTFTPTEYVVDPATGRASAAQIGAMTVDELERFLQRGEHAAAGGTPADVALARGDELLAGGSADQAADAYREALRVAGTGWADHGRAAGSLVTTLTSLQRWHECAEVAAAQAPALPRDTSFGRVVYYGLSCCESEPDPSAQHTLLPLAEEAIGLPSTARDHRFGLYDVLITSNHDDKPKAAAFATRWLDELDRVVPASDDERIAIDISRLEVAAELDDASRVLPELVAAEHAGSASYVTSLRLAQAYLIAKQYKDALAAARRALPLVTGPLARAWVLRLEAEAHVGLGEPADARRAYQDALDAAKQIAEPGLRERNIAHLTAALGAI